MRMFRPNSISILWIKLYILLLLFGPPILGDIAFTARGLMLDHIILFLTFPLILSHRPISVFRTLKWPPAFILFMYLVFSIITGVFSACLISEVSYAQIAIFLWGNSRPIIVILVVSFLARNLSNNEIRDVIWFFLLACIVEILVGLAQECQIEPLLSISAELYNRKIGGQEIAARLLSGRQFAFGTMNGLSNVFGTLMILSGGVALVELLLNRKGKRFIVLVVFLGSLLGLLLSGSRGAMAGWIVMVLTMCTAMGIKRLVAIGSIAVIGGLYFYYMIISHIQQKKILLLLSGQGYNGEPFYTPRLKFWLPAIDSTLETNPILGFIGVPTLPSDNLYVMLFQHGGIIGLGLFTSATLAIIILMLNSFFKARTVECRYYAIGMVAITLGFMFNGVSLVSFFAARVMELYFLLLVLAWQLTIDRHILNFRRVSYSYGYIWVSFKHF